MTGILRLLNECYSFRCNYYSLSERKFRPSSNELPDKDRQLLVKTNILQSFFKNREYSPILPPFCPYSAPVFSYFAPFPFILPPFLPLLCPDFAPIYFLWVLGWDLRFSVELIKYLIKYLIK